MISKNLRLNPDELVKSPLIVMPNPDPASRIYLFYWIPAFAGMTKKPGNLTFYVAINLILKIQYTSGSSDNPGKVQTT